MPNHAEVNACGACARSKRKCGRQMPACGRCVERGKTCVYPSSRGRAASSPRIILSDALGSSVSREVDRLLAVTSDISSYTATPIFAEDLMLDLAFDRDFASPPFLSQSESKADWFLAPETWRISQRANTSFDVGIGKVTMKNFVKVLQSWFECWVTTGSCPFIHPRLYSTNFPACTQIAYATLASYIHRTPATTDTILQIVEDRSTHLLRDNGAVLNMAGVEEWVDGGDQDVDLFAQLARLHAFMVYQIIGLFDGDIRSVYVAQSHMAVQDSWARKLFHSAAKALSNSQVAATHLAGCLPKPSTPPQEQWYLWILAESIRRTWLVAVSLSPIFSALQQGWAACPGGVMYTNRSGLWTAASATEWEKQCAGGNAAFLQRFECGRLLDNTEPADIDEFGTAMLDMTFNKEVLDRWRDTSGGL